MGSAWSIQVTLGLLLRKRAWPGWSVHQDWPGPHFELGELSRSWSLWLQSMTTGMRTVQFSRSVISNSLPTMDCSTPGFPPSPGVCSKSCPLSQWCHLNISSSVAPLSSCPKSFPASRPFPVSQLFALGGWSIGASASASVLPVNIQGSFPLGLTGLIALLSRGL